MTEIFVDTFFWLAALNPRDPFHLQVIQTPKPPRAVTTRAVQIEVMDALSAPPYRSLAAHFWEATNQDVDLCIIALEEPLLRQAAALYKKYSDKAWSLTDCISFVIMRERGITEALTSDHHFEQAGFRIHFK
jgi:predicted nucleic acid-binding protein